MFETGRRIVPAMTLYDPEAWQAFLAEIPRIKAERLAGDALWARIEAAWAPLFAGIAEDEGAQIYEDAMFRLACEKVIPPEWGARH